MSRDRLNNLNWPNRLFNEEILVFHFAPFFSLQAEQKKGPFRAFTFA